MTQDLNIMDYERSKHQKTKVKKPFKIEWWSGWFKCWMTYKHYATEKARDQALENMNKKPLWGLKTTTFRYRKAE